MVILKFLMEFGGISSEILTTKFPKGDFGVRKRAEAILKKFC